MNTFKLYRVYYNLCHCTDEDCAILMAHDEESAKTKLYKLFRGDIHILEVNVISDYENNFDAVAINPRAVYYLD